MGNGRDARVQYKVNPSIFLCATFFRDEDLSQSKAALKKVSFNLSGDEDSEGEEMDDIFGGKNKAKSESMSSFEKRQEKVSRFKMLPVWYDLILVSFVCRVVSKCMNPAVLHVVLGVVSFF